MKKQNIPLVIGQKRIAADSEERIRETRPKHKKEKDPSSVGEAHPDEVFVMEGPDDWAMAHNVEQAQQKAIDGINRQQSPFAYQGVVAALQADIQKTAEKIAAMGFEKEANELMAIAVKKVKIPPGVPKPKPDAAKKQPAEAPVTPGEADKGTAPSADPTAVPDFASPDEIEKNLKEHNAGEERPSEIDDQISARGNELAGVVPVAAQVLASNLSAGGGTVKSSPFSRFLGGGTLSLLGKGLGIIGGAAALVDMFKDGPNVSNVSSLGMSIVPLALTGPYGAIAGGVGLAGTLLYKAMTGSLKETLPEDIDEAIAEIENVKGQVKSSTSLSHLDKMKTSLLNIKAAYAGLGPNITMTIGQNILGIMAKSAADLKVSQAAFLQSAEANDYSLLRHTGGIGFPGLDNVIIDVQDGVAAAGESFAQLAGIVWGDVVKATNKDAAVDTAGTSGTAGTAAPGVESQNAEQDRIRGIQRYFIEQGVSSVEETGTWDGPTYDAMQNILDELANLGITEGITMQNLKHQNYDSMHEIRNSLRNWRSNIDKDAIK